MHGILEIFEVKYLHPIMVIFYCNYVQCIWLRCNQLFFSIVKASLQPVNVFKQLAHEEKAETARLVCAITCSVVEYVLLSDILVNFYVYILFIYFVVQSSFVGAVAIGDLVKSTLGPKGMVCNRNDIQSCIICLLHSLSCMQVTSQKLFCDEQKFQAIHGTTRII